MLYVGGSASEYGATLATFEAENDTRKNLLPKLAAKKSTTTFEAEYILQLVKASLQH